MQYRNLHKRSHGYGVSEHHVRNMRFQRHLHEEENSGRGGFTNGHDATFGILHGATSRRGVATKLDGVPFPSSIVKRLPSAQAFAYLNFCEA